MAAGATTVAFFMHDLSGGGVEAMRLRLAEELLRRGYDVTLIVQRMEGALRPRIPAGVRVIALNRSRSAGCVLPLARLLPVLRPTFLVSSLDHNNLVALCARFLAGRRTRVVICQHNALSAEYVLGWKYRVVPFAYWLLHGLADSIVAVSRGVADDLARQASISRACIDVVYNPVTGGTPTPTPPRAGDAHPWVAARDTPLFVFAGRLVPQKDPHTALRAFALLAKTQVARLAFLGDGPLLNALRTEAAQLGVADRVAFPGYTEDPRPWMAAARAFIMTSRYEGLGNVIIEALAEGTPVIATDCPHGPAEILDNGRYGVLVPVGDAAALADAMRRDQRTHFDGAVLRARAAAFSRDACVARHEAIFARRRASTARRAFGLRFSNRSAAEIAHMCATCAPRQAALVVTPNVDHIRLLRRPDFARACQGAAHVCADGFPVAIIGWLAGAAPARRVTGCDIVSHLLRNAAMVDKTVMAVLESRETELALKRWLQAAGLQNRWRTLVAPPGLSTDDAAQAALADDIRMAAPSVVLMTLGAPTSEIFAHTYQSALPPCHVLCVGQALRVHLGLVRRAPVALRIAGLEWAWRAMQEPRRLLPRYLKAALWFPVAVAAGVADAEVRNRDPVRPE